MRILFFPVADQNMPSSYYRVFCMEAALRERGWDTDVVNPHLSDSDKRAALASLSEPAIVYIQKVGNSFHHPNNFLPFKDKHIFVFDFDDWICVDNLLAMIGIADLLICGSHFLFDRAQDFAKRSYLLECCCDESLFVPAKREVRSCPTVIWMHSYAEVYADDLLSIAEPLNTVWQQHRFELILCGFRKDDGGRIKRKIQDTFPYAHLHDYVPLDEFRKTTLPLMQQADIALAPFLDDPSRAAKAGLTLRNYMLMNIPAIASEVGEHPHIITHGVNGFCARNPHEWEQYLRLLLSDLTLRATVGAAARQSVHARYSVQNRAEQLDAVLKQVMVGTDEPAPKLHASCGAVILGRLDLVSSQCAVDSADMIQLLATIAALLRAELKIDNITFAAPDDAYHRQLTTGSELHGLSLFCGAEDNPLRRFLQAVPAHAEYVMRLTMQTPFLDALTLQHACASLSCWADAVRIIDIEWGIAAEVYSRKSLKCIAEQAAPDDANLWAVADRINDVRCIALPALHKPDFCPVDVSLRNSASCCALTEYALSGTQPSVRGYQRWLINRREARRQSVYRIHHAARNSVQTDADIVCRLVGASMAPFGAEAVFSCICKESEHTVFCFDALIDGAKNLSTYYIAANTSAEQPLDTLEVEVLFVAQWLKSHMVTRIIACTTDAAVFAVRVAMHMNIAVDCILDTLPDPADTILSHHLHLADTISTKNLLNALQRKDYFL